MKLFDVQSCRLVPIGFFMSLMLLCLVLLCGTAPGGTALAALGNAPPAFPLPTPQVLNDTTSNTSWYALPVLYYTPETSLGGGFASGYFFGADPARISSLKADLSATLSGEYEMGVDTELYLQDGRYRLWAEAKAARTPTSFFGIGPSTSGRARESYTRQMVDVKLRGARRWSRALHVGLRTQVRHTTITTVEDGGLLDDRAVPGARGSTVVGIGPSLLIDARSRTYYPQQGHYLSIYALFHPHVRDASVDETSASFTRFAADARRFLPLGDEHVLALQAYAEGVTGTAPFALLPKLGGSMRMRGYRHARFRDQVTVTTQAEWRFPVWWRIDGALFGSVGTIAPRITELGHSGIKPAAGMGMRYQLNDAGVRLRADVAISPDGAGLYLTGSPPF